MNILYISYDGLTDQLGQSQVMPYLIGLSKEHTITLISCEKKDKLYQDNNETKNILKTSKIDWYPVIYTLKPPILSTIYNIKKIKSKILKLNNLHQIEIVHCRSYIPALIGLYLKKKLNIKFVFDMRGFWPDERIESNLWNIKNPVFKIIYTFFKQKEKKFLSQADYVISLTQNAKNEILKRKDISNQPVPVKVIPCCVDTVLFSEQNVNIQKKAYYKKIFDINEKDFVISYLGSLSTWYMPEQMLKFFKQITLKYHNAKLLFITKEPKKLILNLLKKYNIPDNKIIITQARRKEVPVLLSLSKISIFFIKPVFSKKASSPTKMGEIMSMGIPIICNTGIGDTDKIINDTKTGIVINKLNNDEYDKAIDNIESLLSISHEKIRETAIKYFSINKAIESYNNLYEIVGKK